MSENLIESTFRSLTSKSEVISKALDSTLNTQVNHPLLTLAAISYKIPEIKLKVNRPIIFKICAPEFASILTRQLDAVRVQPVHRKTF